MSDPSSISSVARPAGLDFADEAASQTDGGDGKLAGRKVSIIASSSEDIAEPVFVGNEQLISQLSAGRLREAAPSHNPDGRIRAALNELTAYKSPGMANKLRSLVSAIRKFFAFKAPGTLLAATQSSFVASPYASAMKQVLTSKEGNLRPFTTLSSFDDLHSALGQKEQIGEWLKNASVNRVGSELVRSQLPFGRIISEAGITMAKARQQAGPIFNKMSGLDELQKYDLSDKLLEATNVMHDVLHAKYKPDDSNLEADLRSHYGSLPSLADFADDQKNPYKFISSSSNFSRQQDESLRAWLASGLEAINAVSQTIERLIVNHDVTADAAGALKRFTGDDSQSERP